MKHHAWLYVGGDFATKVAAAKALAKTLLCATGSQALWQAGTHPDYFYIAPEENGRSIKIEQVRNLIEKLQQKPQHAAYQVAIIAPAEAMTTAAANALLKTLEEPTGEVVLILISEQPQRLLATVRSRCQIKRFAHFDTEFSQAESNARYQYLQQQLLAIRHQRLDVLELATTLAKENTRLDIALCYRYVAEQIKLQQKNEQQKLYLFLDKLVVAKRYVDSNIAINAQLLWEDLLLSWEVV